MYREGILEDQLAVQTGSRLKCIKKKKRKYFPSKTCLAAEASALQDIYEEGHYIMRHPTTLSDICRYLMLRLCRPGAVKFPEIALIQLEIPPPLPPPVGVNSDQFSSNLRVEQIALPRHLSRFSKQPGSPALQKSNGSEVVQGFRSLHQAPRFSFLLSHHQPKWANCEILFAILDTPLPQRSNPPLALAPNFILFLFFTLLPEIVLCYYHWNGMVTATNIP